MAPRCRGLDCNTQGVFNLPDEPRGGYCKKHKTDEMIDVFNPKCSSDGCSKQPCFNFQGERKGLYCRDHKLEGMVDIKERIICGHNGCTTRAVFNNENEMIYFIKHLFHLNLLLNDQILFDALVNFLNYIPGSCKIKWKLIYFICKKL